LCGERVGERVLLGERGGRQCALGPGACSRRRNRNRGTQAGCGRVWRGTGSVAGCGVSHKVCGESQKVCVFVVCRQRVWRPEAVQAPLLQLLLLNMQEHGKGRSDDGSGCGDWKRGGHHGCCSKLPCRLHSRCSWTCCRTWPRTQGRAWPGSWRPWTQLGRTCSLLPCGPRACQRSGRPRQCVLWSAQFSSRVMAEWLSAMIVVDVELEVLEQLADPEASLTVTAAAMYSASVEVD